MIPHLIHNLQAAEYRVTNEEGTVLFVGSCSSTGGIYFIGPDSGMFRVRQEGISGILEEPVSKPAPPVTRKKWWEEIWLLIKRLVQQIGL